MSHKDEQRPNLTTSIFSLMTTHLNGRQKTIWKMPSRSLSTSGDKKGRITVSCCACYTTITAVNKEDMGRYFSILLSSALNDTYKVLSDAL